MANDSIPSGIIEAIEKGECTLFIGAGASLAANAPAAEDLAMQLLSVFLQMKPWPIGLESVASLVTAHAGNRGRVEGFLKDRLAQLRPSDSHRRLPWYRWRAIVTTNYDQLIEKAYTGEAGAVQRLIPVLGETDLPNLRSAGADNIPLLKPHGCISQPATVAISHEDMYDARTRRRLLFTHIELLHLLGPVIYIGYSFRDVHVLDMILDVTRRLGSYRQPIVFVTHQQDDRKADAERRWFERTLQGEYLAAGFDGFVDELGRRVRPVIGPSWIVRQMAPCRCWTFAGNGEASYTASHEISLEGENSECWFTYTINHEEGYAGVVFERLGDPIDVSQYTLVSCELNVPDVDRVIDRLEALKLESHLRLYVNLQEIGALKGRGWVRIAVPLEKYDIDKTRLGRVVLADNGHRALLGQEYRVGLRKVRFE